MQEGIISAYAQNYILKNSFAYIHSVFNSSLNIAMDGFLLHIASIDEPASCLGINIDDKSFKNFLGNVKRNNLCVIKDQKLKIYAPLDVFCINTNELKVYSSQISVSLSPSHLSLLTNELKEMDLEAKTGLQMSFNQVLGFHDLTALFTYLLGRGKGLTPSGDDFILGFCFIFILTGYESQVISILNSLDFSKTSDVSKAYLIALRNFQVNPIYLEIVKHLKTFDIQNLREDLKIILNIGHTSGADSLNGMYIASKIIQGHL